MRDEEPGWQRVEQELQRFRELDPPAHVLDGLLRRARGDDRRSAGDRAVSPWGAWGLRAAAAWIGFLAVSALGGRLAREDPRSTDRGLVLLERLATPLDDAGWHDTFPGRRLLRHLAPEDSR